MRIVCLIALLTLALPGVAADKVYKKTNPDGTVEFSDQPAEGSEEVKVQKAPSIKFEKPPSLDLDSDRSRRDEKIEYSLSISSPSNEQTIRDNAGNVSLQGQISPDLKASHSIRWVLDGEVLERKGTSVSLNNVSRGSHSVQMQVVDLNGNVQAASDTVTFHLKRHSTIPPANPAPNFPTPKTRSKPTP